MYLRALCVSVVNLLTEAATMTKRVLDVGQCAPDHATIRAYLTGNFDCEVVQVDDAAGRARAA